jgi:uncharacterized protein (DUF58 family)
MEPTRRYWAIAALGTFLAILAIVLARPLLLVGAVGLGAFLLVRQYRFLRAVQRVATHLHVQQSVDRHRVATDRPLRVDLEARVPEDVTLPLPVRVAARPPVAATGDDAATRSIRLPPKLARARTAFEVAWPVAGVHAFQQPTVSIDSPDGFFRTTFESGTRPEVTVEPPRPGPIHVGEGGERVSAGMGEHTGGEIGPGFEPAEIREYHPGDPARHIDWKATARLDHPHVQEFEAETSRVVTLLVDHRDAMGLGPTGETKLDYARELALGFVASARDLNDPLGLYAVGNEGVTTRQPPHGNRAHYGRLRGILAELDPTPPADRSAAFERGPVDARRAADALADDETPFGTTLHPYFDARNRYVERLRGDPLFETVRTHLPDVHEGRWTVVITDDTDRAGVRETVDAVRRHDAHALVFLLPTVLFEPGGLSDLEAANDRYREFERFRRKVASLPRASAFEVGPRDRIDAIFAARRRRRARTG